MQAHKTGQRRLIDRSDAVHEQQQVLQIGQVSEGLRVDLLYLIVVQVELFQTDQAREHISAYGRELIVVQIQSLQANQR